METRINGGQKAMDQQVDQPADLLRHARAFGGGEETGGDALRHNSLALAYIGDTICDLYIRTRLVCAVNEPVSRLNKKAAAVVNAASQSRMVEILEPLFSDEEAAVYRRGRNAKAATHAKNASIQDYRRATGLEAVLGFLYLSGRYDRLTELMETALKELGRITAGEKTTDGERTE